MSALPLERESFSPTEPVGQPDRWAEPAGASRREPLGDPLGCVDAILAVALASRDADVGLGPPPELERRLQQAVVASAELSWLAQSFALEPIDLAIVALTLTPDIDLRYGRLFATLNNDAARTRPTMSLVAELLAGDASSADEICASLRAAAPLRGRALLHVVFAAGDVEGEAPALAGMLRVDRQIVAALLGQSQMDDRLVGIARYADSAPPLAALPLPPDEWARMVTVAHQAREVGEPMCLVFAGSPASGRLGTAASLSVSCRVPLLEIDADEVWARPNPEERLRVALREAWFGDAIAFIKARDSLSRTDAGESPVGGMWRGALRSGNEWRRQLLGRAVAEHPGVVVISVDDGAMVSTHHSDEAASAAPVGDTRLRGEDVARAIASVGTRTHVVRFGVPTVARRRAIWACALSAAGAPDDDNSAARVASRFRLLPGQVASAARSAVAAARWRVAADLADRNRDGDTLPRAATVTAADLFAAARAESGAALAALAARIQPVREWSELVLPTDALRQLRELCARAAEGETVFERWGFGRAIARARGAHALFAGPSGTGKTMAAEVLAHELGVDLFRVDLSAVVSKYIGETEKNLERVFRAAEDANGVLFFDEADALFGRRSEVSDAHDRYANVEISYLLQRMEAFDGVSVLATNLRAHLDEAFLRRLSFAVHFPFPDAEHRRAIWSRVWPAETPRSDDLDLDFVAQAFELSGGNIRNVAVAAAFLAASDGGPISLRHVLHAIAREYEKLGKSLDSSAWGRYASVMEREAS